MKIKKFNEMLDSFPNYDVGDRIKIVAIEDPHYNHYLNKIGIISEIDRENKSYWIEFFDDGGYLNKLDGDKHLDSDVFFETEIEKINN